MPNNLPLGPDQIEYLRSQTQGGTTNFVDGYNDILYDIQVDDPYGDVLDGGARFWYQNAPLINDATVSNPAKFFIWDATEYGLRLDGNYTGNLQTISNAIASAVIQQTLGDGSVHPLPDILAADILTTTQQFNVTTGGWGGSSYYWGEAPTGSTQSVGEQIGAAVLPGLPGFDGGGEYDKFLAASGAALYDSVGLSALTTYATYQAAAGAEAPLGVTQQLALRAEDIWKGSAIVGSPEDINGAVYDASTGGWATPSTFLGLNLFPFVKPVTLTDPVQVAALDAEARYRMRHQDVTGHSNADLNPASPAGDPLPVQEGLPPGIPVDYATTINPDGSYQGTSVSQSQQAGGGPALSIELYTAGGTQYATELQDLGAGIVSITTLDAAGNASGNEAFTAAADGGMALQSAYLINPGGAGGWSSATMSFLADGSLGILGVAGSDGASLSYLPDSTGGWSEYLKAADGGLTAILAPANGLWDVNLVNPDGSGGQETRRGQFLDQGTHQVVTGVQVTPYPGGPATLYPDGSFAAPTPQFPGGAPTDMASEQALWASLLPASATQAMV